uniref:Uncharacterized protein n=1 Tax=Anguilla anguilla TaxID=7936 RepID=A0A0E9TR26_ANGAN
MTAELISIIKASFIK